MYHDKNSNIHHFKNGYFICLKECNGRSLFSSGVFSVLVSYFVATPRNTLWKPCYLTLNLKYHKPIYTLHIYLCCVDIWLGRYCNNN